MPKQFAVGSEKKHYFFKDLMNAKKSKDFEIHSQSGC